LLCNSAALWSQVEPAEVKSNADKFQDYFYESLTQKVSKTMIRPLLPVMPKIRKPQNAVVYFLGKKLFSLKDYPNAFSSFKGKQKSTLQTNGFRRMYDYATSDYQGAIKQSIN
jgi:hypothetical protein